MSDGAARQFLVVGARALAHGDGLAPSLEALLRAVAEQVDAASAAILIVEERPARLDIAASVGLTDSVAAGLVSAAADPRHPIARTVTTPIATFDVTPTAPGGPALRSHLPLAVTRDGAAIVLGVLALAHDRPIDSSMRPLAEAAAELAAVMIDRDHSA